IANSSMLVLPSMTAPADFSFATTVASYGATKLSSMREPQVVRTPAVQKRSLCAIGTPVSAPPAPAANAWSAARAAASATSAVTEMKALSAGWLRSMRASNSVTSSTLEKRRARRPAASCVSVVLCSSLTRPSLDDLRHEIQSGRHLGRVLLVVLVAVALGHHVPPQPLCEPRQRMRHRHDIRGLDAFQGADEVEDARQAVLVDGNFGCSELEARQLGDACDLLACESHGDAWRNETTGPKSYMLPC